METVYIYGLEDPRDDEIHYVGKSADPDTRLRQHLADDGGNQYKIDWLTDLRADGLEPNLVILDEVAMDEWCIIERAWINRGLEQGWPLTNITGTSLAPTEMEEGFDCLRSYLTQENWNRFEELEEDIQSRICLTVAEAVAVKTEFAARAQGWWTEWVEGCDFRYGSRIADLLIENLDDLDFWEKTIDSELYAVTTAMNEYLVKVHGFSKTEIGLE